MATFRVPMMEQTVAATPQRVSSPVLLDVADPGKGIRALGDVAETAAGIVQKVQQDADDVAIGEKLVEFERRSRKKLMGEQLEKIDAAFEGTDRLPGFLETRGEAASKVSGDVLKAVQSDVDELSGLLTPRQRTAFLEKVRVAQMGIEQKVDAHVVQQLQVAKSDLLKAAKSEVKRAVGDDPRDPMIDRKSYEVEQMIAKSATSDADRDAAVADWMGEVAQTQIVSMLKAGDTADAEALFKEKRHLLGEAADDLEKAIKDARTSDKTDDLDTQAAVEVQKWVSTMKTEGGYADVAAINAKMSSVPADDPRFKKMQQHLNHQLAVEAERREADIKTHRNLANQALRLGPKIPPATVTFLAREDAEYLRGLEEHEATKQARRRAKAGPDSKDKAAIEKKQRDDDAIFEGRYNALSPEEQAKTSPEEFAAKWAATHPGFAASEPAIAAGARDQRKVIERLKNGDMRQETTIRVRLEDELPKVLLIQRGASKGKPTAATKAELERQGVEGDPVQLALGRAMVRYRAERERLGRDLTPEEEAVFLSTQKFDAMDENKNRAPGALRPVEVQSPLPGGYGAPFPLNPAAPTGIKAPPVMMVFPDGKTYPVSPEKMDAARRKGAKEAPRGK